MPVIFHSDPLVNEDLAKDSSLNLDFSKEKRGEGIWAFPSFEFLAQD